MVGEPEEIPDAEHEQVVERVCAIDVANWVGHAARCLACRSFSAWPPAEPRGHLSVYEALQ